MAIERVDLPINSMVILHSFVNVYQRVYYLAALVMKYGLGYEIA